MRVFLVLAVVLVAVAVEGRARGGGRGGGRGGKHGKGGDKMMRPPPDSLCTEEMAENASNMFEAMLTGVDSLTGDCYPRGDLFSNLLRMPECIATFEQGFCYNAKREGRFESFNTETDDLDYSHVNGEVEDLRILGKHLCRNAGKCYRAVRKEVLKCHNDMEGWLDTIVDQVTTMYEANVQPRAEKYASMNNDTMSGSFINIVMDRFTSPDDISNFFGDIAGEQSDAMTEDAMSGYEQLKGALRGFCADKCVDPTADFLLGVTGQMSESGTCVAAAEFCGDCSAEASAYVQENAMPCCLQRVVDLAITGVDYARDTYGDKIQSLKDELKEVFAGQPEMIQLAEEKYQNALDQAKCFRDMYEADAQTEEECKQKRMDMMESA
jgi:hypothetical protein